MTWRDQGRERVKQKSEGVFMKLLQGENCIRILPDKKDFLPDGKTAPSFAKGINSPVREFRTHRDVGPDKAFLGCGKNIEEVGECWLCDTKIPELRASGSSTKRVMADAIDYQEQFMVQASRFDPDAQKFQAPKPWWVSSGSSNSLAVRVYSKITSSKKDYLDPDKGYNLNVTRTGEGLKTRYPSLEGDESPTRVPQNVRLAVKDLDSLPPSYSEEDQKAAYFGRARQDDVEKETETEEEPEAAEEDPDAQDAPDVIAEDELQEYEAEEEPESEELEEEPVEELEEEPEPEEEIEEEPEPEPPPSKKKPPVKAPPPPVRRAPAPAPVPTRKTAPPATTKRR